MINIYDIWFSNVDISNKNKLKLIKKYNKSEVIWNLNKEELIRIGLNQKNVQKICDNETKINLDKYINYIEKYNIKLIFYNDFKYPTILKFISNPPAFLYIRGKIENLYDDCVAIVGSRDATEYGKYVTRKTSKMLADRNLNIVSRTRFRN